MGILNAAEKMLGKRLALWPPVTEWLRQESVKEAGPEPGPGDEVSSNT